MRVLLDSCVYGLAIDTVRVAGHDVRWVGDEAADPGDEAVLALAAAEARVLITLDNDFGELAVVRMQPHHGIVRLVGIPAIEQGPTIVDTLAQFGDPQTSGALIVVERGRTRVRPF